MTGFATTLNSCEVNIMFGIEKNLNCPQKFTEPIDCATNYPEHLSDIFSSPVRRTPNCAKKVIGLVSK